MVGKTFCDKCKKEVNWQSVVNIKVMWHNYNQKTNDYDMCKDCAKKVQAEITK